MIFLYKNNIYFYCFFFNDERYLTMIFNFLFYYIFDLEKILSIVLFFSCISQKLYFL